MLKGYYELRTLRDASDYINQCLAKASPGPEGYPRHEVAAWIVGLGALDVYEVWREFSPYWEVANIAADAEIDEPNANDNWPALIKAARALEDAVKQIY